MELHLIRHGQTNWNEERRVQGQSESELTSLGIQQAQELGERISQLNFDKIFCSSSKRTRQTAEHVFPDRQHDIEFLDSLREIFLGPWEGRLYDDIQTEEADSHRHFWQEPHLFDVKGAETFYDLQNRAVTAVEPMLGEHHQQQVVIVSHGALIKSLLSHIEGRPMHELWAPPLMHNCAHSIIRYNADGSGEIIQYADQSVSSNS
jgi:probable phosphoglycerate mutase